MSFLLRLRSHACLVFMLGALAGQTHLFAQITWDGDCSQWWPDGCTVMEVPRTNWSNDGYPAEGDDVVIDFPAVAVAGSVEVLNLASLQAKTRLRILHNFSVTGEVMLAESDIDLSDGRELTVGGTLQTTQGGNWFSGNVRAFRWDNLSIPYEMEGTDPKLIGTPLNNFGTVNLSGARSLRNGSSIRNDGNWIFAQSNPRMFGDGSDGVAFINRSAGTITRNGSGNGLIELPLSNEGGRFDIQSGQLNISRTANLIGSIMEFTQDSSIQFLNLTDQPVTFSDNNWAEGSGNVRFAGLGLVTIDGTLAANLDKDTSTNGLHFATGSTIEINGLVTNATTGKAFWDHTDLFGPGEFINRGSLEIDSALFSSRLTNQANGVISQTGNLTVNDGTIQVLENSFYELIEGNIRDGNGTNTFNLLGSLEKLPSPFSSTISIPVNASGNALILIEQAVTKDLFFNAGGTFSGQTQLINESSNASLILNSGTFSSGELLSRVTTSGDGKLLISSNADWILEKNGDRVTFGQRAGLDLLPDESGIELRGTLTAAPGALFINNGAFHINGGRIEGGSDGVPAFSNLIGEDSDIPSFADPHASYLRISSSSTLDGHFHNYGTILLTGGSLTLTQGSVFRNLHNFSGNSSANSINGAGSFINRGTFAPLSNMTVSAAFDPSLGEVVLDRILQSSTTFTNLVDTVENDTLIKGNWIIGTGSTLNLSGHTIKRIGADAMVIIEENASFPQYQLEEIQPGASANFKGNFNFPGALRNSGNLKAEDARLAATEVVNQSNGKIESVLQYLDEAIVIAKGNVPFESVTYEKGFAVSEGFENAGYLYPGGKEASGYFPVTGSFTQTASGIVDLELAGKTNAAETPAEYDQLAVIGAATLNGNLLVRFLNGFETSIASTDTFTVIKATSISGTFSNAASGGRLYTADDLGSFLVTYSETEVTLSDFQTGLGEDAPEEPALVVEFSEESNAANLSVLGDPGTAYFLEQSTGFIAWDIIAEVLLDEQGTAHHEEELSPESAENFFRTRIK